MMLSEQSLSDGLKGFDISWCVNIQLFRWFLSYFVLSKNLKFDTVTLTGTNRNCPHAGKCLLLDGMSLLCYNGNIIIWNSLTMNPAQKHSDVLQ